ncbi:MAG TPA: hypothetical protein VHE11_11655 [Steroidobacteraceae bacterium]|nr:hypothetical protein [Steroidobacteraceae bacterium]
MPSFRARNVRAAAAALVAATLLTGCASSRLSSEPPPGVRLAGDWKVDPAGSDDLGKAIEQLRAQTRKARQGRRAPRETSGEIEGPPSGRARSRGRGPDERQGGEAGEGGNDVGPGAGAEEAGIGAPRLSAVDELMSSVPRGEYLTVTVSATAFTVRSGGSSDQYVPGVESEISAQRGDAQQISGWKGGAYVIDTKPQWGPEIIQSYGLTKDGRLALTVRLTGRGINFVFTRVYERTTRVAPLAPPTND